MKVVLFGGTGMIGQGVLREALLSHDVESVLTLGRRPSGHPHAKVRELVRPDLYRYDDLADELRGWDACFFCLGQSSVGLDEAEYTEVTYELTLAAARALAAANPRMTFVYVSAAGAEPEGTGRTMWARVRGRVERDLEAVGFARTFVFRPGLVEPQDGIKSGTRSYRIFYTLAKPLLPSLRRAFPDHVSSTRLIGRAMIAVARDGYPRRVLHAPDFREASRRL